jgi:hypothetical protein
VVAAVVELVMVNLEAQALLLFATQIAKPMLLQLPEAQPFQILGATKFTNLTTAEVFNGNS